MMRSRYSLTTTLVAVALLLVAGQAAAFSFGKNNIKGSGDMETRTLDLKDFHAIDVGGAFDLDITLGDKQKVVMTIDDNLWDNLEAEVHGGTLEIGWDKSCNPDGDCRVEIVVRKLDAMDIHGAADVGIRDFHGDSFSFDVSGAAELDMDGTVDKLDISVSGAGDIDTRDLKAKVVKISVSGAGEAKVFASESFEGRVSGVGNIDYWGDPEHQKTKVSGMGDISRK
ncbi:MAG: head GIN domain-containing protein [Candidatus Krumholzibacteriota bacterium]